ncbi:LOW QUALITY PROTEIN: actin nucleation-promoting factor WAS-like [Osmerus mordax]|uniref:LOW QUALITY PROTEIN: actin nucleation-promoting factor WAS-like n=1 Tax=Osmerus mordax TaxID=8014 RepID=UPI00350ED75D
MSRGSKAKLQQGSRHSTLLSPLENERLEDLTGRRCASLATAVVQLFMALPHSPTFWSLQHTGVACFIKDNPQRSYFIRLFDVKAGKLIWEQEVYAQMSYFCPRPFFHSFAGDNCQVGLNFANVQEAENFQNAVEEKISQRDRQASEKKQRPLASNDRGSLPPRPPGKGPVSTSMATIDIQNPDIQASRYRSVASPPSVFSLGKSKKEKKSKKKGSKFSKADIGAPSGFTHVSHVGWDPNNLDPDLKKLLSSAGISEEELKDEETSQLIQNVIEQSGGMEAVKKAMNKDRHPPPPSRQGPLPPVPGVSSYSSPPAPGSACAPPPSRSRSGPLPPLPGQPQRGAPAQPPPSRTGLPPPPPSARAGLPPPPPSVSYSHSPPPPPPGTHRSMAAPPASTPHRGGPAPPPPPPPPPSSPSTHFRLPSSSSPCGTLKPPPPTSDGGGGGEGRGDLLNQIRLGKKLKNVTESPDLPSPAQSDSDEGIVGALMMVMQKRSKVIHSSDEDEDDGGFDDDEDDEWDD